MNKIIKKSKRGLTFIFDENEAFHPGTHYTYDIKENKIIITPAESGNTVSRKKCGKKIKSLLDIRKKEVVQKVQAADYMDVAILEDKIIVTLCKKAKNNILKFRKAIQTYVMPTEMLLASGQQLSIDQWINDNYNTLSQSITTHTTKRAIREHIKVISLFSGAGMLDYPFYKDDNFDIILACDYNAAATKTYRHNIGNHIIYGDIKGISDVGNADVVIGGPSCKAFSNENRHTRMLEHEDFFLYQEYIRIVKESNPKIFVMENVPQFLTAGNGDLLKNVIESFPEYEITTNIITDNEVGGYTKRKRVFLIGSRIGKISLPKLNLITHKTVKEALEKVDATWFNYNDISVSSKETKEKMSYVMDGNNWEDIPVEKRDKGKHSNHYRRLKMDDLCPTLTNFRKVCLMPPREIAIDRIISVAEASALSGLDKNFEFLGKLSERQQQVGNGVPYRMASLIKETVKKALCKKIIFSM